MQAEESHVQMRHGAVTVINGKIIPIEVKSGAAGRLRSLHLLLKSYPNCPFAIVFSSAQFSEISEQRLKFFPIYFAFSAAKIS